MSATKRTPRRPWRDLGRQAGHTAVEFALLSAIFFMFVFGLIETARTLFVLNTLHEVTRRAVAVAVGVYPNNENEMSRVRSYAVFRSEPGELMLAPPVTDEHIRLEYLRFDLSVIPPASWPESAAANRQICMLDPQAPTCIRFVQASVCELANADECIAVTSRMMLPLIDLRIPLHRAVTIAPVESLGYVGGTRPPAPPCPTC